VSRPLHGQRRPAPANLSDRTTSSMSIAGSSSERSPLCLELPCVCTNSYRWTRLLASISLEYVIPFLCSSAPTPPSSSSLRHQPHLPLRYRPAAAEQCGGPSAPISSSLLCPCFLRLRVPLYLSLCSTADNAPRTVATVVPGDVLHCRGEGGRLTADSLLCLGKA
jgi:hypothetical protein